MNMTKKRLLTSLSIVTLLAPTFLSSTSVFAEDHSMGQIKEGTTETRRHDQEDFTQIGPDLEATDLPTSEKETTAPIQKESQTPTFDTSNGGTEETATTSSTSESLDSSTEVATSDSTSPATTEETYNTSTEMTSSDSSQNSTTEPMPSDSTEATSDGATEEQPEKDWTGGIGLDDLEIDETKEATITLTAVDFVKNENNSNFVKTTEDGLLSVKLNTHYYLASYLGYDREEDVFDPSVDAFVKLADPTSGTLYSFSSNPGHIYVWDLGSENSQTFYFKDKKGKVIEYTLIIKTEEEPTISTQDFEMSEKSSGRLVSTPDKLVEITPNYEKFNWQINTTDDQWKILNYNPENYQISKAYEKRTYNIVLYSEELQKVNIYKFKVDRMISENELVEHEIDLKLSRNNQFGFANEFYQTYDHLLPGLSILGYYNYDEYNLQVQIDSSESPIYLNEYLYYSENEKDTNYTSYLEVRWWEEKYDENSGWQSSEKQVRIKLNIQLDNTTAIDEDQERQFHYEVDYNDLVIDSKEGTPKEVTLNYGGPSNYTESFGIAYLNTNDFDDGKDVIYQGEYVEFYKGNTYVNVLYESSPGNVQAYSNYGNPITFTILNAPRTNIEEVEVTVGVNNDWENAVIVSPKSDDNLKISAYRDYGGTYSLNYDYDYNGIHHYEAADGWEYLVPEDVGTLNKTIYKRQDYGGKIVAIYKIQFNLEKIEYELQEPLYLSIPKKLGFNRVYAETPDGQVVIVGTSQVDSGDNRIHFFAYAIPTSSGEKNNIQVYYDGFSSSLEDTDFERDPFLYTIEKNGVFKKYPVNILPDTSADMPTKKEYFTYNLSATSQELAQVNNDIEYYTPGKTFQLAISKYESWESTIYLDRENKFKAHSDSTPVNERFILFFQGILPFKKTSTDNYELTIDYYPYFKYNLTITDNQIKDILPKKLSLSDSKVTLSAGETATISATVTPEDATNKSVTWTSSDQNIATVVNGVIVGVKEGKATITAETVNGLKKTVKVTVKKAPEKPIIKEELKDEAGSGISVSAPEGVLPKGAELKVEPIQTKNEVHQKLDELTEGKFALFDIKLHNSEFGQNVQPNGTVTVRVPIPSGFDPAKIRMYRFDERTGKRTALKGWVDGAYYVFETDHFSYYALVEEEPSVSKEALSEWIEKGQELNGTNYTPESWNLFMEKLRIAKTVLANDAASDYEVKRAIDELTAGMEGLVNLPAPDHSGENTDTDHDLTPPIQKPSNPGNHLEIKSEKEQSKEQSKEHSKEQQMDLPQLGESMSYTLLMIGVSFISLAAFVFFKRRKLN